MAASGVDPRQPKTISSAFHYFQPLTEFLAGLPSGERVVLVGHSFGGLGVAVALEEFPEKISVGVFDLSLAITLVRPFPLLKINDSEFKFTEERYGSVKRAYVITER
ncbi:Methylesterase 1, partial [Cucurbita argyrosperma subsp. argyrosperma]